MEFIETDVFTKWVVETITDDSYRELQSLLAEDPTAGQIYMLFAYSKKEQGDLTNAQRKALVNVVKEI